MRFGKGKKTMKDRLDGTRQLLEYAIVVNLFCATVNTL